MADRLTKREITKLISRQRLALCDRLDELAPAQFEVASYCDGWRVRDVLGHLVSIVSLPMWKFAALTPKGVQRRFDINAKEFGEHDPADLIATYRSHSTKRVPVNPAGRWAELSDVTAHSLDITEPLGLDPVVLDGSRVPVLNALAGGLFLFTASAVKRCRFIASDIEWSHGSGPEVRATSDHGPHRAPPSAIRTERRRRRGALRRPIGTPRRVGGRIGDASRNRSRASHHLTRSITAHEPTI